MFALLQQNGLKYLQEIKRMPVLLAHKVALVQACEER